MAHSSIGDLRVSRSKVTGLRPAAVLSGLRRSAASPESGSEDPRTQSTVVAAGQLSTATEPQQGHHADTTTCLWVRGSSDPLPPEAARRTRRPKAGTASRSRRQPLNPSGTTQRHDAVSLGARACSRGSSDPRATRAGGGGRNVAGLWPAAALLAAAIACAAPPTDDRAAELEAREAGNPGGENFGEFGPPDAYEGDSPHPYYGSENEWSRRMFAERAANLYYKRRGQRQLLEILDGRPRRAIRLADARLAAHRFDAESWFIKAVALAQVDRIEQAEEAMLMAIASGMPAGRFLAGPRELLERLAATETFTAHAARPKNAIIHGPMLGAVTDTSARVWIRTTEETQFEVVATATGERHTASGATSPDRDFTGKATLQGLSPDTSYSYHVLVEANTPPNPPSYTLRDLAPRRRPGHLRRRLRRLRGLHARKRAHVGHDRGPRAAGVSHTRRQRLHRPA